MSENKQNKRKKHFSLFKTRTKQPNFMVSVAAQAVAIALVVCLVLGVSCFGLVLGIAKGYYDTTPYLDLEQIEEQDLTSFIYDMNGDLITDYKGSENRIWASFEEIPEQLYMAFVCVEDARFFSHNGIDIKRIVGAFVSNLRNESVQGGSTITQQLIKTRLLTSEQSYKRKIQEAYMAIELEKTTSKEQILEWYLNTIPLGESNYGIKAAAKDYFDKDLDELTLRECATLAGIARNPTRYNPRRNYYGVGNKQYTDDRTDYVLRTMYENNAITHEEYLAALEDTITVVEESTVNELYDMPAAVETVLADATDALLELRGLDDTAANRKIIRNEIQTGGYSIYSTIDPTVQNIVEQTVYNWEYYPALKDESKSVVRTQNSDGTIVETIQPQAAVTIIDYSTGELRGIVGSRTPPTQFLELNRARVSTMPVGSSIKPLAVYGPALDLGYSPATVVSNLPLPIEGWGTAKGYPSNFTSSTQRGVVTLRKGMRSSLNIVAANTLMNLVGIDTSVEYLKALGIEEDMINKDGAGLALGSSGIPTLNMAAAFGAIANRGLYQEPISFTKIVDADGNVILDMKQKQTKEARQALKPGTAYMLVDMLVGAVNSGTGTSARISGLTVGGKTGTHSDYKSVFFAGFTPYYSGAVWVGHDYFESLYTGATGGKDAAPLWKAIMEQIHETYNLEDKPIIEDDPEDLGLVRATVCSLSGLRATDACRLDEDFPPVTDYFHEGTVPTESCNLHAVESICTDSGKLATIYCPATSVVSTAVQLVPAEWGVASLDTSVFYKLFPHGIISYMEDSGLGLGEETMQATCDVHGPFAGWDNIFGNGSGAITGIPGGSTPGGSTSGGSTSDYTTPAGPPEEGDGAVG